MKYLSLLLLSWQVAIILANPVFLEKRDYGESGTSYTFARFLSVPFPDTLALRDETPPNPAASTGNEGNSTSYTLLNR